jgi:hypothetical protein
MFRDSDGNPLVITLVPVPPRRPMKKFLALAAVVVLVACEKKPDTTPAADSGAMMAPDTTTMMHDSMTMDSGMMRTDSMPRDTTHQM